MIAVVTVDSFHLSRLENRHTPCAISGDLLFPLAKAEDALGSATRSVSPVEELKDRSKPKSSPCEHFQKR
jgi:hypothetical protein